MQYLIFILYVFAMTGILAYCLLQLSLAMKYMKSKRHLEKQPESPREYPVVTVQLPIFNELYVVDRLLDAVASLDYPKDKLEIQILDDSTDETQDRLKKIAKELSAKGQDVVYLHRSKRSGFKAGALQEGMKVAKGEFIAIFDADFIPHSDFLLKTIPWFADEKIGVVQTRWLHINKDFSLLTKIQALAIDVHFTIEQRGRNSSGYFINFNGTAGVWRKTCIEEAGGWSAETLTEDLDLSYRAQLKGWKFKYLEDVGTPAELPAEIHGYKSQQYRWNKGGAETARKIIPRLIRSNSKKSQKLHGIVHLLNSSVYLFILGAAVLSVPMLWVADTLFTRNFYLYLSIFLVATIATSIVFFIALYSTIDNKKRALPYYLGLFPLFLSVNLGLSWHNARAVVNGLQGKRTPFIRTPKFNIISKSDNWKKKKYTVGKLDFNTAMEGLLALYFLAGIALGIYYGNYGMMLIHLMAAYGFATIFYHSVLQKWLLRS
jgi:cellulose synthase/poly-beta-1,6-N-acetylglucosamine synthase-like glycosyltransferase